MARSYYTTKMVRAEDLVVGDVIKIPDGWALVDKEVMYLDDSDRVVISLRAALAISCKSFTLQTVQVKERRTPVGWIADDPR